MKEVCIQLYKNTHFCLNAVTLFYRFKIQINAENADWHFLIMIFPVISLYKYAGSRLTRKVTTTLVRCSTIKREPTLPTHATLLRLSVYTLLCLAVVFFFICWMGEEWVASSSGGNRFDWKVW